MVTFDTEVVSSYGRVDVGRITKGDKLMSPYGYRRVEHVAYGGYLPVREYKIFFDEGEPITLTCTEKQMVYTDYGFVPMSHLAEGMKVDVRGEEFLKRIKFVIYDNGRIEDVYGVRLEEKKYLDEETETYVEEHGQYYANNILIKAIV